MGLLIFFSSFSDSGGVACLPQCLKALCAFVNLHSRSTYNDFIVLSTANQRTHDVVVCV